MRSEFHSSLKARRSFFPMTPRGQFFAGAMYVSGKPVQPQNLTDDEQRARRAEQERDQQARLKTQLQGRKGT